eukprot:COSAG01_NODE_27218_length_690_cov_1.069257_2_plen_33_part_01
MVKAGQMDRGAIAVQAVRISHQRQVPIRTIGSQ